MSDRMTWRGLRLPLAASARRGRRRDLAIPGNDLEAPQRCLGLLVVAGIR